MKILSTGLSGLIGSRLEQLLSPKYSFISLDGENKVDITNKDAIEKAILSSDSEIVLHLAAKTNVDSCEDDKALGKEGDAYRVNVEGTKNVSDACQKSNKKLIHISTAFVFDGEKEYYSEEDKRNAVNWYGQTKLLAEEIVENLSSPWLIVRPDYPYRAEFERLDFMRAIKGRLEQNQPVNAVTDSFFCPTFIDDLALALDTLISKNATGIYNSVGSDLLCAYDCAMEIASIFNLDSSLISKTTAEKYFFGKAKRPLRLALKNDKIARLGVNNKSFRQGLLEVKKQLLG